MEIDRAYRQIMRALQADGRITNARLASLAGVSPATCFRRTRDLFRCGWIRQVRALVSAAAVGRGTMVLVGVVLDRSTPDSFAAFETAVQRLGCVLDCYLVAGDFDYFLKIRVSDMAGFNLIHGRDLIALPGVRQTRTFFVMKEVIDDAPIEF